MKRCAMCLKNWHRERKSRQVCRLFLLGIMFISKRIHLPANGLDVLGDSLFPTENGKRYLEEDLAFQLPQYCFSANLPQTHENLAAICPPAWKFGSYAKGTVTKFFCLLSFGRWLRKGARIVGSSQNIIGGSLIKIRQLQKMRDRDGLISTFISGIHGLRDSQKLGNIFLI